jgi:hypothetical protein
MKGPQPQRTALRRPEILPNLYGSRRAFFRSCRLTRCGAKYPLLTKTLWVSANRQITITA